MPDQRFAGVYPILYAFFDSQGRLDREAMRRQVLACVAGGAHGIAALGLATEVRKLSADERRQVMAWLIEDVAGRLPVAITVYEETAEAQIAFAREAASLGAAWVILQPPKGPIDQPELIRFFGRTCDALSIPVGIQNAPQFLGVDLDIDGIVALNRVHPNLRVLKGETSALEIARLADRLGDAVAIFNGRAGLEFPDVLRAGGAGMIPAPECFDLQVELYEAFIGGDEDRAEAIYARILPLITFLMQSVDQFLCYGKRLTARRLGLGEVFDRQPAQAPTALGLDSMRRYSAGLGPFRLPE